MMLQPVILNTEKLNSQVMIRAYKISENEWSFTLNNMTRNTYKVFLESYMTDDKEQLVWRKTSSEFMLNPGIMSVTETEIGNILLNKILPSPNKYRFSLCVKQKFGPDLGFRFIQI